MRKVIMVSIFLLISSTPVLADFVDDATSMAKQMIPVWQKLYTCSPVNNDFVKIYGINNNKCHFKYINYDCNAPLDVTKKYAHNSIKGCNDLIHKGNFSTSPNTPEAKYNEWVHNNYCKGSGTYWTVESIEY